MFSAASHSRLTHLLSCLAEENSSSGSSRRGSTSSRVSGYGYGTPKSHTSSFSTSPISTPFFPASPRNSEPTQPVAAAPKLPFGSLQPPRTPQQSPKSQTKADKDSDSTLPQSSPLIAARPLAQQQPPTPNSPSPYKRQQQQRSPSSPAGTIVRNRSEGNQLFRLHHKGGPVSQPLSLPTISPLGVPLPQPRGLQSLLKSDTKGEGILNGERVRSQVDQRQLHSRDGSSGDLPRNISDASLQSCDSQGKGSTSSGSDNFFSISASSLPLDSGQESDHSSIKSLEEDSLIPGHETSIPFGSLQLTDSPLDSPSVDSALTFPFSPQTSGDSLLTPIARLHAPTPPWATGGWTPVGSRVGADRSDSQLVDNVAMSESTATIQGDESDVDGQVCLYMCACSRACVCMCPCIGCTLCYVFQGQVLVCQCIKV